MKTTIVCFLLACSALFAVAQGDAARQLPAYVDESNPWGLGYGGKGKGGKGMGGKSGMSGYGGKGNHYPNGSPDGDVMYGKGYSGKKGGSGYGKKGGSNGGKKGYGYGKGGKGKGKGGPGPYPGPDSPDYPPGKGKGYGGKGKGKGKGYSSDGKGKGKGYGKGKGKGKGKGAPPPKEPCELEASVTCTGPGMDGTTDCNAILEDLLDECDVVPVVYRYCARNTGPVPMTITEVLIDGVDRLILFEGNTVVEVGQSACVDLETTVDYCTEATVETNLYIEAESEGVPCYDEAEYTLIVPPPPPVEPCELEATVTCAADFPSVEVSEPVNCNDIPTAFPNDCDFITRVKYNYCVFNTGPGPLTITDATINGVDVTELIGVEVPAGQDPVCVEEEVDVDFCNAVDIEREFYVQAESSDDLSCEGADDYSLTYTPLTPPELLCPAIDREGNLIFDEDGNQVFVEFGKTCPQDDEFVGVEPFQVCCVDRETLEPECNICAECLAGTDVPMQCCGTSLTSEGWCVQLGQSASCCKLFYAPENDETFPLGSNYECRGDNEACPPCDPDDCSVPN